MKTIKDLGIDQGEKTFIIAEIGINHGGDLKLAKKLIHSAARAGADAVKFQTYITDKRVSKNSPIYHVLRKCELPFEAFKELKAYSDEKGVLFFSTPFDDESVDYLESISTCLYKIASFDVTNNSLLRKISKTGKPIILSVGMSTIEDIKTALAIIKTPKSRIALLHCISAYPTNEKDANIGAIRSLISSFPDIVIGHSDHTNDILVPLYAVAAGAQIIEKHYKLSEGMDCVDASVSISEHKFSELVRGVRRLEGIIGSGIPHSSMAQKTSEQFKRFSD